MTSPYREPAPSSAPISRVKELQSEIASARATYQAKNAELAEDERQLRELSDHVKTLQRALSDEIVGDAKPCPDCGARPIGIEQPKRDGGVEYEIGCPACPDHRARGGPMPSAARDAWNAGSAYWKQPQ